MRPQPKRRRRNDTSESSGAARPAGVHPGRCRAAVDGQLRTGRARQLVRESIDISEKKGVLGAGYIPKNDQTTCTANSKGLFAYYRSADAGLVLTCRMADGSGSGWAGITGVKDLSLIDAKAITEIAVRQSLEEPEAAEDRARPLHRHSRAPRQCAVPLAHDRDLRRRRWISGRRAWRSGACGRTATWRRGCGWSTGWRGASRRRRSRRWRRPRWWRRWWTGWRRRRVPRRQKAWRQGLQRSLHAEERHRQSGPAPDADSRRQPSGQAGDVGREGAAPHARRRQRRRRGQHEPRARGLGAVDRRDDQADAARAARDVLLVHPRRAVGRPAVAQHRA